MSIEPTLEEQTLLAARLQAPPLWHVRAGTVGEAATTTAFAAALAALWATNPPDGIPVVQTTVCVLVLALATMIEFDTPFGYTVPTQLAFVPLVFAVPLAIVPLGGSRALTIQRPRRS